MRLIFLSSSYEKFLTRKQGRIISFAENKEEYISFNVKIIVKLARVCNKEGKGVRKNIRLRFIDSCRFMVSSLDKLASNWDDDQLKLLEEFYYVKEYGNTFILDLWTVIDLWCQV